MGKSCLITLECQIEVFGRSLWARYLQALERDIPFPEDGYGGAYMNLDGSVSALALPEMTARLAMILSFPEIEFDVMSVSSSSAGISVSGT